MTEHQISTIYRLFLVYLRGGPDQVIDFEHHFANK